MTRYGWDLSDYDWSRGPLDIGLAHKQGIDLVTHKISEGTGFRSLHAGAVLTRGLQAGVPVLGGYHVLYPKTMTPIADQVEWYLASLDELFPQWRKHPCFIHQVDAEKFQYMPREPSVGEINTFAKTLMTRAGCLSSQIIVYGPHWLYGEGLTHLHDHPLWASAYVTGSGGFKDLYPGDDDARWAEYSGITPTALQYSSISTIAGQHPSDANAIRVSTVEQLVGLFVPKKEQEDDEMTMSKEVAARFDAQDKKLDQLLGLFGRKDDKTGPHHIPHMLDHALEEHGLKSSAPRPGGGQ